MAKEPDDRYGSAGALGRAAMRALTDVPTAPRAAPTMPAGGYVPPPRGVPPPPNYGFPSGPRPYNPQFGSPGTGPDRVAAAPPASEERSSRSVVPIVVAVAAAVVVVVVAATIGVLVSRNTGSGNAISTTTGYSTPSSNPYDTGSPSTTSSRTTAPTIKIPRSSCGKSPTATALSCPPNWPTNGCRNLLQAAWRHQRRRRHLG